MSHSVNTTLQYGAGTAKQYSDWLLVGQSGVQILSEAIDVTLPRTVQWVQGFFLGGKQLATQIHLVSRLKVIEAVPPVPHIPSWYGQEQLYLSYLFKLDVHLQVNVLQCGLCTHFVFLQCMLWIS
jgi:hypothetical protein